jgi:hypothetical protein
MSARARQREQRREALRLRCAHQREQLAQSLSAVQQHLEPVEKAMGLLRSLRRMPLLLGSVGGLAAIGAMLFSGRSRRAKVSPLAWWLPLAAPALRLLELWWQHRAGSAAHTLSEAPDRQNP